MTRPHGSSAIIQTYMIPVKIVLSTGQSFDPFSGGPFSPVAMTLRSPIFDNTTDYVQGGVNVGTTQYVDAYQRANFWSLVSSNPNYHVLLGSASAGIPILPELTLNVPAGSGHIGSPFGHQVAEVDINYFDSQISAYMVAHPQIHASGFPIFITTQTYLTEGGCCIGGYHSANGPQTYAHFTYIQYPGDFSQDVSALSHEVGEWMDDPLTNGGNGSPCGILENGDPLEGGSPATTTVPGPTSSTTLPITCRTWCSCVTSVEIQTARSTVGGASRTFPLPASVRTAANL